jgi:NTP pyrophosphatase (non-canonical NTP hydrolase)
MYAREMPPGWERVEELDLCRDCTKSYIKWKRLVNLREKPSSIKDLQKDIHQNAVDHGFYEGKKNIPELIALCHSELSEALEEYRSKRMKTYSSCVHIPGECEDEALSKCPECEKLKPEGFGIELADCVIRILDLAEYLGYDMEALILQKHKYNKTRPYKHGKVC